MCPQYPEHFRLQAQHNIADILREKGELRKAEDLFRKTLEERTELLGDASLDTAHTKYGLCLVLESQRRYEDAEKLCREAIEVRKNHLVKDPMSLVADRNPDPDKDILILTYTNALGNLLRQEGQLSEADGVLRRVFQLRKGNLGPGNLDTLFTQHLLGLLLRAQGKHEDAEAASRQAFLGREKVLGRDHAATMFASHALAVNLRYLKRYREAEMIFRRDLDIKTKMNGSEHADNIGTIFGLAQTLRLLGDFEEATELLKRCLEIEERAKGADHENTLDTVANLAACYQSQTKHERAEPFYRRYHETKKATIGLLSPRTLEGLYSLGMCYLQQYKKTPSKLPLGLAALQECFDLRKQALGPDHPHTLVTAYPIALAYQQQGEFAAVTTVLHEPVKKLISTTWEPTAMSESMAGPIREMLRLQGDSYWDLGRRGDAKMPYRRLVASSFSQGKAPSKPAFLVRAGIDQRDLVMYLETMSIAGLDRTSGRYDASSDHNGAYCDGCQALDIRRPRIQGLFYHCLECDDTDICSSCFKRLQQGDLQQVCLKEHAFVEVSARFWKVDGNPPRVVDERGRMYNAWLDDFKARFLEEMAADDGTWMRWLIAHVQAGD